MTDLRQLHAGAIDRACDVEAVEIVECLRADYTGTADDLFDQLHEVLDGHQWVFLTGQAEAVRYGSRHSEAYAEEMGEQPSTVEACAYVALQRHVMESDEWDALYQERRSPVELEAAE